MTIVISSNKDKFYKSRFTLDNSYTNVSKSDVDIKDGTNIVSGAVANMTITDIGRNITTQVTDSSYTITQNGAYTVTYSYQDASYVQTIALYEDTEQDFDWKLPFTLNAAVLIDDVAVEDAYDVFGFVGKDSNSSLRLATTLVQQGPNYWIQPGLVYMNSQGSSVLDRIEFYKDDAREAKFDSPIDLTPGPAGTVTYLPFETPPPGMNGFLKAYSNALPVLLINNEPSLSENVEMGESNYNLPEITATATDKEDDDAVLTSQITSTILDKDGNPVSNLKNSVASANHNDYFIVRYSVSDSTGASVNADYIINIIDTESPDAPQLVQPSSFSSKYNKNTLPEKIVISGEANCSVLITGTTSTLATSHDNGTYTISLDNLEDGTHNIEIKLKDSAGNESNKLVIPEMLYDGTKPDAPQLSTPGTLEASYNIDTLPNELILSGESGCTLTIVGTDDNLTWTESSTGLYTISLAALTEGTKNISLYLSDSVGNNSDSLVLSEFSYDGSSPNAPVLISPSSILSAYNKDSLPKTITVSGEANCTLRIDGASIDLSYTADSGSYTISLSNLEDGTHNINIILIDQAGNESTPLVLSEFLYEGTLPVLELNNIDTTQTSKYDSNSSLVNINASDVKILKKTVEINGAVPVVNVTNLSKDTKENNVSLPYKILSQGLYSIEYEYTDGALNRGSVSRVVALHEDTEQDFNWKLPFTLNAAVLIDDEAVTEAYTVFGHVGTGSDSSLRLSTTLVQQGPNYWIQPGLVYMNSQNSAILDRIEFYKGHEKIAKFDDPINLVPGPAGMITYLPTDSPPPEMAGFMKAYTNTDPFLELAIIADFKTSVETVIERGTKDYTYIVPNILAIDAEDGDISASVTTPGTVYADSVSNSNEIQFSDLPDRIKNAKHTDQFVIRYSVSDAQGATAIADHILKISDTIAPLTPVLKSPSILLASNTNDVHLPTIPTIEFTAEPNCKVIVKQNDIVINSNLTAGLGEDTYTFTPTVLVSGTNYTYSFQVKDDNPDTVLNSPLVLKEFTFDNVNPPWPNIITQTPQFIKELPFTIDIESEEHSILNVYLNDISDPVPTNHADINYEITNVSGENTYQCKITSIIQNLEQMLRFSATDRAGNDGEKSNEFTILYDTINPNIPTIKDPAPFENNSYINDVVLGRTMEISTENYANVTVKHTNNNGEHVTFLESNGDSRSYNFSNIIEGENKFTVMATDRSGRSSANSIDYKFIYDITNPVKPAYSTDVNISNTPFYYNLSTLPDNIPIVGEHECVLTTYKSTDDGDWANIDSSLVVGQNIGGGNLANYTFPLTIPENKHGNVKYSYKFSLTDKADNTTGNSVNYSFFYDVHAPAEPIIKNMSELITGHIKNKSQLKNNMVLGVEKYGKLYAHHFRANNSGNIVTKQYNIGNSNEYIYGIDNAFVLEGENKIYFQVKDRANNLGNISTKYSFVFDETKPITPSNLQPSDKNGGYFNDSNIFDKITLDAEAETTIKVFQNSVLLDGGNVSEVPVMSGKYEFTLPVSNYLSGTRYIYKFRSVDTALNESDLSAGFDVNYDNIAPDAPTINNISSIPINHTKVTSNLELTAEEYGNLRCKHIHPDNSDETITYHYMGETNQTQYIINPGELSQGLHQYKFLVTDRAQNDSNVSFYSFIYDTVANPPILDAELGDLGNTVWRGYLGEDDVPQHIKFSAESNSSIVVFRNNTKMDSAIVDEYEPGKFRYTLEMETDPVDGNSIEKKYIYKFNQTDLATNVSGNSVNYEFYYDNSVAGAPVLYPPESSKVIYRNGDPSGYPIQLTFRGEDGNSSSVYINDILSTIYPVTPGNVDGSNSIDYRFNITQFSSEGTFKIEFTITDKVGRESPKYVEPLILHYITTPPPKPTLLNYDGNVIVTYNDKDNRPPENITIRASYGDTIDKLIVKKNDLEITDVSGSISVDNINSSGNLANYTYTMGNLVADGLVTFSFQIQDKAGNSGEVSDYYQFNYDTVSPDIPNVLRNGNVITVGHQVKDFSNYQSLVKSIIITGEPDCKVNVFNNGSVVDNPTIINGNVVAGNVVDGTTGKSIQNYEYELQVDEGNLTNNEYNYTFNVEDVGKNTSGNSIAYSIIYNNSEPNTPSITSSIVNGTRVNTFVSKIDITATKNNNLNVSVGETGASILVYINEVFELNPNITEKGGGEYEYNPSPENRPDGEYKIKVKTMDKFGNISEEYSNIIDFVLDTIRPNAPLDSLNNLVLNSNYGRINTKPEDIIFITENNTEIMLSRVFKTDSTDYQIDINDENITTQSEPINSTNTSIHTFSILDHTFIDGNTYEYRFKVKDGASNISEETAVFKFKYDTSAPNLTYYPEGFDPVLGYINVLPTEIKISTEAGSEVFMKYTSGGFVVEETQLHALPETPTIYKYTVPQNILSGTGTHVFTGETRDRIDANNVNVTTIDIPYSFIFDNSDPDIPVPVSEINPYLNTFPDKVVFTGESNYTVLIKEIIEGKDNVYVETENVGYNVLEIPNPDSNESKYEVTFNNKFGDNLPQEYNSLKPNEGETYKYFFKFVDRATNVGPEKMLQFEYDVRVPPVPDITSHNIGSYTNILPQKIDIESTIRNMFRVFEAGVQLYEGPLVQTSSQNYSYIINGSLPEQVYNYTFSVANNAGTWSNQSDTITFTYDKTAPPKPLIGSAVIPHSVKTLPPYIEFTAEAGIKNFYVSINGSIQQSADIHINNTTYRYIITGNTESGSPLPSGTYKYKFKVIDDSGNESLYSNEYTIIYDIDIPDKPTLQTPVLDRISYIPTNISFVGESDCDVIVNVFKDSSKLDSISGEYVVSDENSPVEEKKNVDNTSKYTYNLPISSLEKGAGTGLSGDVLLLFEFSLKDSATNIGDALLYEFKYNTDMPVFTLREYNSQLGDSQVSPIVIDAKTNYIDSGIDVTHLGKYIAYNVESNLNLQLKGEYYVQYQVVVNINQEQVTRSKMRYIRVIEPAPQLSIYTVHYYFKVGDQIDPIVITNLGGSIDTVTGFQIYSSDLSQIISLPTGLNINILTGTITGIPTSESPSTEYIVRAKNKVLTPNGQYDDRWSQVAINIFISELDSKEAEDYQNDVLANPVLSSLSSVSTKEVATTAFIDLIGTKPKGDSLDTEEDIGRNRLWVKKVVREVFDKTDNNLISFKWDKGGLTTFLKIDEVSNPHITSEIEVINPVISQNIGPVDINLSNTSVYSPIAPGETVVVADSSSGTEIIVEAIDDAGSVKYIFKYKNPGENVPTQVDISGNDVSGKTVMHVRGTYAIYITFGSVIITSNGGSSGMGDPYINPVLGNMYKMPSRKNVYRFISDNNSISNHRFVINAGVTNMSSSVGREVVKYMKSKFNNHIDYRKLRSSIILNGYYFNKFFIHNSNNQIILDLDKLSLVHHSGTYDLRTISNKRLMPLNSNVPSNREFNITVNNTTTLKTSLEPYVDELYTKEIVIETTSLTYGPVQIKLYIFDNPQIRTGIRFITTTNINEYNSAGLIVKYTDLEKLVLPQITDLVIKSYNEFPGPIKYRNEIFYKSNNTSYQKTFIH